MRKIIIFSMLCLLILLITFFAISYLKIRNENHINNLINQLDTHFANREYDEAYMLYSGADEKNQAYFNDTINNNVKIICEKASKSLETDEVFKLRDAGWNYDVIDETIALAETEIEALRISHESFLNAASDYENREFESALEGFEAVISGDENYADAQEYINELNTRDAGWNDNITGRSINYNALCFDGEHLYMPFMLEGVDGIYKISASGEAVDFFPLSNDAGTLVISSINSVGEYIYFIAGENVGSGYIFKSPYCVYEMKKDGTNLDIVLEGNYTDLFIKEDSVYALSRELGLVEYDRYFKQQKIISQENVVEFSVNDAGIYYTVQGDLTHDSDNTVYFYDGVESAKITTKEYMQYYRLGDLFLKHWHNNSSYELLYLGDDDEELGIRNADIYKVYGILEGKVLYSCNGSLGRETLYTYQIDNKQTNQITESKKVMDFVIKGIFYEQDRLIIEMDGALYLSDILRMDTQKIDHVDISEEKLKSNSEVIKHIKDEDIYFAATDEKLISVIFDKQNWHYKDSDLNITIEKRYADKYDCNVYITHIFTKDYSLFTTGNAKSESLVSMKTYKASSISDKYHAIYAQNTDTFLHGGNGEEGIIIRQGEAIRNEFNKDMLVYYDDGRMEIFNAEEDDITGDMLIDDGAVESFSFGPILVEDYKVNAGCAAVRLAGRNPRSAIGYVEQGHYVMIACDGRDYEVSRGLTFIQLANIFKEEGCKLAYNLDGGMSTTVLFMGNYITHRPPYGTSEWFFYRSIAEIMYVGTSENSPTKLDEYMCDYNYFNENYK